MDPNPVRLTLLSLLIFASHCGWLSEGLSAATAFQASPVSQVDIDKAIDRGAEWLLEMERIKAELPGYRPDAGRSALALYAILNSDIDKDSPFIHSWAEEFKTEDFNRTYDATCLILALVTLDPVKHWDKIRVLTSKLAGWQNSSGDWGYPGGADLSCTQFAALGLWKAGQAGIQVDAEVWQRLADRTLDYQLKNGSFCYSSGSKYGSASMTAAGAGTLAICESQLRLAGELEYALAEKIIPARNKAKRWLGEDLTASMHPSRWQYYYLYGLERFGALSGHATFFQQDWYQMGARVILANQLEDGNWMGDSITTSFALLFLARATAADHGPVAVTGGDVSNSHVDTEALCWLDTKGSGPMSIGVLMWNRTALRAYEWPNERGLGPRVSWVEYFSDGERIAIQLADSSKPLGNRYFRFHQHFRKKGAKEIFARFHLELPPKAKDLPSVIQSDTVTALVQHSLPELVGSEPIIFGRKIYLGENVRANSTSTATKRDGVPHGLCKAPYAVDGSQTTAWVFRPSDKRRELTLKLKDKSKINLIEIYPCLQTQNSESNFLPLRLLEITINHKLQFPLLMPSDGRPGKLSLDEALTIRHLEIRILTLGAKSENAGAFPDLAGIAEVTFYSSE